MEPGTVLQGRYVVDRLLARGGMSTVYLAHHQVLGHPVAVKRLELEERLASKAAEAQAEFLREGLLLAGLEHPSIVKVSDFFVEDDGCFLVMTYVDGQTLGAFIRAARGPVALDQGLAWAREIGEAVRYLHGCTPPVLYRDLKPDNVMIDRGGRIKVLDMGIARRDAPDDRTQTILKGWGTPHYSAPEQLAGMKTDPRSDIYAYGATLYALFTGERPTECLKRLLHAESLTPPSAINPHLPPRLEALIVKAMAVQAEDRHASMDEIVTELADIEGAVGARAATPLDPVLPKRPKGPLTVIRRPREQHDDEAPLASTAAAPPRAEGGAERVALRPASSLDSTDPLRLTPSPDPAHPSRSALPPELADLPRPAAPPPTSRGARHARTQVSRFGLATASMCAVVLLLTVLALPFSPAFLIERTVTDAARALGVGPSLALVAVLAPSLGGALAAGMVGATRAMLVCLFFFFLQLYPLTSGLGEPSASLGSSLGSVLALSVGARLRLALGLRVTSVLVCALLVAALALTSRRRGRDEGPSAG